MLDPDIIPGARLDQLAQPERLAIWGLRLIGSGRGGCPALRDAFAVQLGNQADAAMSGLARIARCLPAESARPIVLGWLCIRGLTWDEAAILALLESAQRACVPDILLWLDRLGVQAPSADFQRGLAWTAAAYSVAGKSFRPDVSRLGAAVRPAAKGGVSAATPGRAAGISRRAASRG